MTLLSTILAQETFDLAAPEGIGAIDFTLSSLVSWAITALIVIAGLIFFFMLVIGGIKWILSGGDKGQTEAARGQITAALIGIIIVFSAWAIIGILENLFGFNLLGGLTINQLGGGS